MNTKNYVIPKQIIDAKEEKSLITLTDTYNKMIEPSIASKALSKVGEKIPQPIKDFTNAAKEKLTDSELIIKSLELLGKSFQTLEQFAAKVTLSEKDIIKMVNPIIVDNEITSLDEICLARGYDISKLVGKAKFVDIIATLIEGGVTGYAGFVGLPFNLVASTFLFYRAVQSTALFYGYDIKNDPAELQIASEVFMNAMSPKNNNDSELSSAIAKVMILTTTTSVKQTVKKGWTAMAEKGGVHLLITQMRALANSAAKKALEKAGKKGLEKTVFSEVFEQLGKKLTQKSIGKAIPKIGAFIGATIDTAQMVQILKYADVFYNKRFLLEKETKIELLCGKTTVIDAVADDTDAKKSCKAKMKNFTYEAIYEVVKSIPKGKVATYGQVAVLVGNANLARTVGNALHSNPDNSIIPCHRVVNHEGKVAEFYAFGGPEAQRKLLESEGIVFKENGRIDLKKYGIEI